jgi:hypothetical protein
MNCYEPCSETQKISEYRNWNQNCGTESSSFLKIHQSLVITTEKHKVFYFFTSRKKRLIMNDDLMEIEIERNNRKLQLPDCNGIMDKYNLLFSAG